MATMCVSLAISINCYSVRSRSNLRGSRDSQSYICITCCELNQCHAVVWTSQTCETKQKTTLGLNELIIQSYVAGHTQVVCV